MCESVKRGGSRVGSLRSFPTQARGDTVVGLGGGADACLGVLEKEEVGVRLRFWGAQVGVRRAGGDGHEAAAI